MNLSEFIEKIEELDDTAVVDIVYYTAPGRLARGTLYDRTVTLHNQGGHLINLNDASTQIPVRLITRVVPRKQPQDPTPPYGRGL